MKSFIIKVITLTSPFFILYLITINFICLTESPDLLRVGLIPNIHKNYRNSFPVFKKEKFVKLSNAKKGKYKIMTIGDSFSEQEANGYKNFLATNFSVLHVDRYISNNQIQTLVNLSNGDFFDHYKVEYIILQIIERHTINCIKNINLNSKITINELDSIIKANRNIKKQTKESNYNFFSRTTINFPYYFLKYFLTKNYLSNDKVYNFELNSEKFFSNSSKKLLFYYEDLKNVSKNNNIENCRQLNNILNYLSEKLTERNIKLIFLPCPDKLDLYFEFIVEKKSLLKPLFFDNFRTLKKKYIYIETKEILTNYITSIPDIYYFDDTHWSTTASKIIAEYIENFIINNEIYLKDL